MNRLVTIYYPISFESKEVRETVNKYGTVLTSPAHIDTREIYTDLPRTDLKLLEAFFNENEIPYDLMEYSKGVNAPTTKKSRPEQGFEKEIQCVFYQNEEEEVEEGVVAVSTLLSIIEKSDQNELAEKLLEEIKKATFKFDNIENIFEM